MIALGAVVESWLSTIGVKQEWLLLNGFTQAAPPEIRSLKKALCLVSPKEWEYYLLFKWPKKKW